MKRKILSAILSLAVITTFLPKSNLGVSACEETFSQDNIIYQVLTEPNGSDNGTVQVGTGIDGSGLERGISIKNITIPTTVINDGKSYDVVKISDNAFYGCNKLERVNFPTDSYIERIGYSAFYDCTKLGVIEIPASVQFIGDKCFERCKLLPTVVFPEDSSLISIGNFAFYKCSDMINISIPDSVTELGIFTFSNCHSLRYVGLPKYLISIGDYAFSNCEQLIGLTIPDGVESIGKYSLSNCSALYFVDIASTVRFIDEGAFWGCSNLTDLQFSADSKLERVYKNTFKGCFKLIDTLWIPSDVEI